MFLLVLGACTQAPGSGQIAVTVLVDGKETEIAVDAGSTVQSALKSANIQVNSLDRLDPPNYSILTQNTTITITRIREEYDVEEVVIPFEKLTQRNESLAEGQTMLMQTGINGMKQITYRTIFEDMCKPAGQCSKKKSSMMHALKSSWLASSPTLHPFHLLEKWHTCPLETPG